MPAVASYFPPPVTIASFLVFPLPAPASIGRISFMVCVPLAIINGNRLKLPQIYCTLFVGGFFRSSCPDGSFNP